MLTFFDKMEPPRRDICRCKMGFQDKFIKYDFHSLEPLRPVLALKLAKSADFFKIQ
jgi:hypothetical protein